MLQHGAASADDDITAWLEELETADTVPVAEPGAAAEAKPESAKKRKDLQSADVSLLDVTGFYLTSLHVYWIY